MIKPNLTGVSRIETDSEHFLYYPTGKKITRLPNKNVCDEAIQYGLKNGIEKCFDEKVYTVLNLKVGEPFVYKVREFYNGQVFIDIVVSESTVTMVKSITL